MSAKRGASGLSGILLVDKPSGLTSHDVVNRVRRATGEKRVGHAGTLDPMATGLLVVLVGPSTRLASALTAAEKAYDARIVFGTETDTDDAEGTVTVTADVPADALDPKAAAAFVAGLRGEHEQVPPAYSAIKRDGVTAYDAARKGTALEIEARTVRVSEAELLAVHSDPPAWDVALTVSKGTYIRAIARDAGRALGSAAHLGALRRTRSGALTVADAVALADIVAASEPCDVAAAFTDPLTALGLPVLNVAEEGAVRVSAGQTLSREAHCTAGAALKEPATAPTPEPEPACPTDGSVAIAREGVLLALYTATGDTLRAQTVFPGGVKGGEQ